MFYLMLKCILNWYQDIESVCSLYLNGRSVTARCCDCLYKFSFLFSLCLMCWENLGEPVFFEKSLLCITVYGKSVFLKKWLLDTVSQFMVILCFWRNYFWVSQFMVNLCFWRNDFLVSQFMVNQCVTREVKFSLTLG